MDENNIFAGVDISEAVKALSSDYTNQESNAEQEEVQTASEAVAEEATEHSDDNTEHSEHTEETANSEEPTFEITYNGEKLSLSKSEIITLAQKGKNYEKAIDRAKREGEERNPYKTLLEDYAKVAGQSLEDYLVTAKENLNVQKNKSLVDEGVPEEYASELREYREQKKQKEQSAPFDNFVKAYPDITPDMFPREVMEKLKMLDHLESDSVVNAYREYELDLLRRENAALKAAEKNRATTPSSVKSSGVAKEDPFLSGIGGKNWR